MFCFILLTGITNISDSQTVDVTTLNSANITDNVVLNRTTTYLMSGNNNVENRGNNNNSHGTVIKGDFNTKGHLIIKRGGKIFAEGHLNLPVLFTKQQTCRIKSNR